MVKGVAQAPEIAAEDLKIMFDTNVTGLINMTQAVLSIFKKRTDGGRGDIINIGSIAGREPYSGGSIYCATKAAVRSFTDALRRELVASRIRIIEIDPGQVETVWIWRNVWLICGMRLISHNRNSLLCGSTATSPRPMLSTSKLCQESLRGYANS